VLDDELAQAPVRVHLLADDPVGGLRRERLTAQGADVPVAGPAHAFMRPATEEGAADVCVKARTSKI
jgi:hypothetical protein